MALTSILLATGGGLIICAFLPDIMKGVVGNNSTKIVVTFGIAAAIAQSVGILATLVIIRSDSMLEINNPDIASV